MGAATILVGGQALTPGMARALSDLHQFGHAVRSWRSSQASDWSWRIDGKLCSGPVDRLLVNGWADYLDGDRDLVVITDAGRAVLKERGATA